MTFSVLLAAVIVITPTMLLVYLSSDYIIKNERKNNIQLLLRYFNEIIAQVDAANHSQEDFNAEVQNITRQLTNVNIDDLGISFFVISSDGVILSHTRNELLGKNIADVASAQYLVKHFPQMINEKKEKNSLLSIDYIGNFFSEQKRGIIYYDIKKISNENGEKTWLLGCFVPSELVNFVAIITLVIQLFFSLVGFLVLFIAIFFVSRSITRPLRRLHTRMRQIVYEGLDVDIPVPSGKDEVSQLSIAFNSMRQDLKIYINEREKSARERQRIESELNIAAQIQRSIVPVGMVLKTSKNDLFDLDGFMRSAKIVGGDFYDFFSLDENKICMVIADVSGKSVPGAILSARTHAFFRSFLQNGNSLGKAISDTNSVICQGNDANMFVTLLGVVVNLTTGECELCSAGHTPPVLLKPDGTTVILDVAGGLPLGIDISGNYESSSICLSKNDVLYLYTDGVTEALNINDELFGENRMLDCLTQLHGKTASEINAAVHRAVNNFVGEATQSDDVTAITFRYL
ncbi:MAG: SpoIIE family protein phosphatase [Thermoguttaceae bacterium]